MTSAPLQEHTGPRSRHPLRAATPALEAVLRSGIRRGSAISAPVPNGSYILKSPMAGKEGGRETSEAQQISYYAIHLVRQHSGGRGGKPVASLGALACSSRDRLGQGPRHFTSNQV